MYKENLMHSGCKIPAIPPFGHCGYNSFMIGWRGIPDCNRIHCPPVLFKGQRYFLPPASFIGICIRYKIQVYSLRVSYYTKTPQFRNISGRKNQFFGSIVQLMFGVCQPDNVQGQFLPACHYSASFAAASFSRQSFPFSMVFSVLTIENKIETQHRWIDIFCHSL